MKSEQILKKAIEKAVENGWNEYDYYDTKKENINFILNDHERPELFTIIFSHDFAKAFWGEEYIEVGIGHDPKPVALQKAWRANLQKMVLEKDPLKYIERCL